MPNELLETTIMYRNTALFVSGVPTAIASGVGNGTTNTVTPAQKASSILCKNSTQRDSLLHALQALFADDNHDNKNDAFNSCPAALQPAFKGTNDAVAVTVKQFLLGLTSGVSHVSQLPTDSVSILKHGVKNVSYIEDRLSENSHAAVSKASTFADHNENNGTNASASIASVSKVCGKRLGDATAEIEKDLDRDNNSHAQLHATVVTASVGGSLTVSAAPTAAVALVTDAVGQVLRETQAVSHSSKQDSNQDENNVFVATVRVSSATANSNSQKSHDATNNLEQALSHLQPASRLSKNHFVISPFSSALARLVALGLFVESSRSVNFSALETSKGRTKQALEKATEQGPCGGIDRINSLHANLCSLSNIMRLCAENFGNSRAPIDTAVRTSEVLSSRSISVALSHVKQLSTVLRQLTNPEAVDNGLSTQVQSTVDSAKPERVDNITGIIKAELDKIEAANERHVIPGLNHDIAVQLASTANGAFATGVSTHSIFTNPSLLATRGLKAAAQTEDAHKNEAVMTTLPEVTQILNTIQAFTRNAIAEMDKANETGDSKKDGPLLSTHKSSGGSTATCFLAVSAISLLCDELLSICRSLTLLDEQRKQALTDKISALPTQNESDNAKAQISWDSHAGQNDSVTAAITALRITFSHVGVALSNIALALDQAVQNHMDTVQHDLVMHTLQQQILACSAQASRYLAEGLLLSTGGASALPMISIGSADSAHQSLHSADERLHPKQLHSSENCTKKERCSHSTQPTGFSIDVIAGTVVNLLKVLSIGTVTAVDTTIQLIKLLEILSLHRDPGAALQLETRGSAAPNGVTHNASSVPVTAGSVGFSALLFNLVESLIETDKSSETNTAHSIQNLLKKTIDEQINGIATLEDEEEILFNVGLKAFYTIMIQLLSPNATSTEINTLVSRLHMGGIYLSSYHSQYQSISYEPIHDQRIISQFAIDDDAQGLLRHFIDVAKRDFNVLKLLQDRLSGMTKSTKAQIMYNYVFDEVYQVYKQVDPIQNTGFFGRARVRRMPPTVNAFNGVVLGTPAFDTGRRVSPSSNAFNDAVIGVPIGTSEYGNSMVMVVQSAERNIGVIHREDEQLYLGRQNNEQDTGAPPAQYCSS